MYEIKNIGKKKNWLVITVCAGYIIISENEISFYFSSGSENIENNFKIFRILYAYGSIELLTVFAFLLVMTFIIYILAQVLLVGKISLGDVFSILLVTVALVYVYWSMKRLEKKLYQKLSN